MKKIKVGCVVMRPLEQTVRVLCLTRLGREPNLEFPTGYNDKIQWLKLYDQTEEHVRCCDKLRVRDYAREALGTDENLLTIYQSAQQLNQLSYLAPCMVKANHDSGSARAVSNRVDWFKAKRRIKRKLSRTYGVDKGEWAYAWVKPMVFTEERMTGPVVDYKFHCCNGRIKWVQMISDRASGHPIETITGADGKRLPLHMDQHFRQNQGQPDLPSTWSEMCRVAQALSEPFRYVRVDLYTSRGRVYIGEMTFWPLSGTYQTEDEQAFGEMLDFDISVKREPLTT